MRTLSKFMFRRDRFQITLWLLGLVGISIAVALAFANIFETELERQLMYITMENPAMIAMVGPIFSYTHGGLFANSMLLLTGFAAGMMNIFLVVRHTRADEEEGRLEVIRSLPVSRRDTLLATLLNSFLINLALALLIGISLGILGIESMDMGASLLYGAALGATGLAFAGITALLVQISANTRSVLTYGISVLGLAYLLRGIGDVSAPLLSAFSPLGLTIKTEIYVNNYWWPIFVLIAIALIFSALALYLNTLRDLGAGFLAAKPGRSHGSRLLRTNLGLSLRLSKGTLVGWGIGGMLLGASYGSVFGDLDEFLNSNDMFRQLFDNGSDISQLEQFLGFLMVIFAIIAAIPVVSLVLKVRGEEKKNRTEHLLGRCVSRFQLLFGYSLIAAVSSVFMVFLIVVGLYGASVGVMDEPLAFGGLLASAMAYLPAIWVIMGAAIFFAGFLPSWTKIIWFYLGFSFMAVYLGQLLQWPEWVINLSPFGHIPSLPVDDLNLVTLLILTVIAIFLACLGFGGIKKRDIHG